MSPLARVGADDGPAFDAWFECYDRAQRDASGSDEGWLAEEWRARAGDDTAPVHSRLYRLGPVGSPDAVAAVEYNDLDDARLAIAELYVEGPRRRRGLGTALLAGLVDEVRALGRDTLMVRVLVVPGGEAASAALGFAGARGLAHTSTAVRRVWDLDDTDRLAGLEARGRDRARGYAVLVLDGPTPAALLAERARLAGRIAGDVPDAGAGAREEHWDPARVRDLERHVAAMGRRLVVAVARDRANGRLVGFSEVTVSRTRPRTAYQWGTFVEPEHRGRGVATWMKAAAARALVAASPATSRIVTENDARNAPVIAMNEALGFRVTAESLVFVAGL